MNDLLLFVFDYSVISTSVCLSLVDVVEHLGYSWIIKQPPFVGFNGYSCN